MNKYENRLRSRHFRAGYRAFEPNFTKEPPVNLQGEDLEDWEDGYLKAKEKYGFQLTSHVPWCDTSTWKEKSTRVDS